MDKLLETAALTVIGNFSVDRVDNEDPTPGGCPSFAGSALAANRGSGRVITRMADVDRPIFRELINQFPVAITVMPATVTSAFSLRYIGEDRTLTVDAVGEPWTVADIKATNIRTEWVHVSPLLRSDFPAETIQELAANGHRVSYDGQGLVRPPKRGELELDARIDRDVVDPLTVLKMSEEEADVVAGIRFDATAAKQLAVPEILVTFGSNGCDLYVDGHLTHVPAARPILGVHTTGAGDCFTVSYVAQRASGASPGEAATMASESVAQMLEHRRVGDKN